MLDFIKNQPAQYRKSAKGLPALFKRYADNGREQLTLDNFHEANKQEKIWEFIKGSLRIYCFIDEGDRIVLLSHGIVKKAKAAKRADINRAVSLRDDYLNAKAKGTLEIITDEDDK